MKLSEITPDELANMTLERKWHILCDGVHDEGETAEVALLLGTKPDWAEERALAAAKLYRAGRVRKIIPTGGVLWDYQGDRLTEAEVMTRVLVREGVPLMAIIQENEAQTTSENMIFGCLQMARNFARIPESVIIVTMQTHMKRSMALAKALLPRKIRLSMVPSYPAMSHEEWMNVEINRSHVSSELRYYKKGIEQGDLEDLEFE